MGASGSVARPTIVHGLGTRRRALNRALTVRRGSAYRRRPSVGWGVPSPSEAVGAALLPGAFVGMLIGSGDPVQAGAAQMLVLVGLLAAETLAVVITVELVVRGSFDAADRVASGPWHGGGTGPSRHDDVLGFVRRYAGGSVRGVSMR